MPEGDEISRVLHLEFTSLIGGGQHSLLTLLQALPAEPVPLLACPAGPLAERAVDDGLTWLPIPGSQATAKLHPLRTPKAILQMHRAAMAVRNHARRERADLVHANSVRAGLIALWARTLGGPPCVIHVRDVLHDGILGAIVGRAIAHADATVAISRFVAARLPRTTRDLSVVDNPVDFARFDPATVDRPAVRAELGLAASAPVLTLIAQITPWKGQDRALRLLAALREQHPAAQLLLVGEAKFVAKETTNDNAGYERRLHAIVDDLALSDAVHFTGEREDVERVLAASDILLSLSTREPFGRTIVEGMAMGVAVVAIAEGGPAELLRDGVDGVLLDPDDPETWATVTGAVLTSPTSLGGAASRQYARQRFSAEHHAERMCEIYAQTSSRGRRRSAPAG
jgi:glycosyltransferase involved in cell wall biosynthesis